MGESVSFTRHMSLSEILLPGGSARRRLLIAIIVRFSWAIGSTKISRLDKRTYS